MIVLLVSAAHASSAGQDKHWLIQSLDRVMEPYLPKKSLNDDLPENCQKGSSKACLVCDDGYYRAHPEPAKIDEIYCFPCSVIDNCRLCQNKDQKKLIKGQIQCTNCAFPKMPNLDLDKCIGRKYLAIYFIGYVTVAIVLGILSAIESKKLSKVNKSKAGSMLRNQLLSNKDDVSSQPEPPLDIDEAED